MMTVIDLFCGAGGFSEGFRQQGFEIILGIDRWKPAIETFNYNFGKNFQAKNILDYINFMEEMESLPDSDVIIGSPPCVSFSNSNKSGKADKSLGLQLTECFLSIVAIKKHKPNSTLKAWYMENVVNSKKHLKNSYTFNDLKLTKWAEKYGINPNAIAINLIDNSEILNSADYGSMQIRRRLFSGEIIKYGKFIPPLPTNGHPKQSGKLPLYKTLRLLKENFPSPYEKKSTEKIKDPLYDLEIEKSKLSDHFYDTGIYECEWSNSKYLKLNHPYMGKMSFPENIDAPSRTITATKIGSSREAIIYDSEIKRKGDGEFRTPTIREAAVIMGFPITYQFIGSENTKWRLVGNAVSPSVSMAIAKKVLASYYPTIVQLSPIVANKIFSDNHLNLNTFSLNKFNKPPIRKKGARFRRHPFKDGNLTVTLSNYNIEKNGKSGNKWYTTIQYGTGDGFPIQKVNDNFYKSLEIIIESINGGKRFIELIKNGFSEKIASSVQLQKMYEMRKSENKFLEPTELIKEIEVLINQFNLNGVQYIQKDKLIFKQKEIVPLKQLFALYAINNITHKANNY